MTALGGEVEQDVSAALHDLSEDVFGVRRGVLGGWRMDQRDLHDNFLSHGHRSLQNGKGILHPVLAGDDKAGSGRALHLPCAAGYGNVPHRPLRVGHRRPPGSFITSRIHSSQISSAQTAWATSSVRRSSKAARVFST